VQSQFFGAYKSILRPEESRGEDRRGCTASSLEGRVALRRNWEHSSDFYRRNAAKRYIHPQRQTFLNAMEKAREVKGGHNSGHNAENTTVAASAELPTIN
jgi:hypothetical protein